MKTCPTCNATYPSRFSVCPQDGAKLAEAFGWDDGSIIRGKYRILSKLGQGGMGAVYKASHMVFDELRALKVINAELITDETFLKRFKQEAVIARKLDHPNAVRVDDLDESEDGLPFIVMEYIEGRSLKDLIEKEGPVEPHRAVRIASQVAAALDAAHRLGMVHRDIKPANIVLIQSPSGEQAKVLDFGIAKLKEARSGDSSGMTLTGTGIVVGTPQYMSPEQALGKRGSELDGRSDLYSLGVVLYQMLAGQLPFKADTTMQILLAHINTPPRPILEVRPDSGIPPALAAVVMKCLAKDPHDRPASGAALIEALRAAETDAAPRVAAEPEDLSSATQVLRPQHVVARAENATPSVAVTTPPPTMPLPATPTPIAPTGGTAGETGAAGRRGHTGMIAGIIAALVVIGIVAVVLATHPFTHHPSSPPAAASATAPAIPSATTPSSAESSAAPPASGETAASQPGAAAATSAAITNAPAAALTKSPEKTAQVSKTSKTHGATQSGIAAAESRKPEKTPPASKPPQTSAPSQAATLVAKATPPPTATAPAGNPSLSTVVITTSPGAHIFVDGKSAGVAGSGGRLTVTNLSPGTHDLRASLTGFNDIDYTVQVPPGGTSFVHANWGASQSQVAHAASAPNASAAQSVAASFPVVYLHTLGSSKGLLVIEGGNVHYQPSNGSGAFFAPLSAISWGSSGRREFYIRLKDGGMHRFRSPSAGEILATLQRAAQSQGRPSLEQ